MERTMQLNAPKTKRKRPIYKTENKNHVIIWYFNKDFSQYHINFEKKPCPSNACTIIAVLVACRCHYDKLRITRTQHSQITDEIIEAFRECIMFGNQIHKINRANGILKYDKLTVPEAIQCVSDSYPDIVEWRTDILTERMSKSLYRAIKTYFQDWCNTCLCINHPDFYIIIIADGRSVVLIFQDGKISLIDSHQHFDYGAIVAQTTGLKIKEICAWYCSMNKNLFHADPRSYELTAIYFSKPTAKNTNEPSTSADSNTTVAAKPNSHK